MYSYEYDRPEYLFKKLHLDDEKNTQPHYFGLELEVYSREHLIDCAFEDLSDFAEQIAEDISQVEEHWLAKHDGSLDGHGFELESLPCTKAYHQTAFRKLNNMADKLQAYYGYSNGLHVNCDNTLTPLQQSMLIYVMNSDSMCNLVETVAQRSLRNRYCCRINPYDYVNMEEVFTVPIFDPYDRCSSKEEAIERFISESKKLEETIDSLNCDLGELHREGRGFYRRSKVIDTSRIDKHSIVHIEESRIEFRIFKANILATRLNKALDFCSSIIDFVKQLPLSAEPHDYRDLYTEFVANNYYMYPDLVRFLAEKGYMENNNGVVIHRYLPKQARNILTPKGLSTLQKWYDSKDSKDSEVVEETIPNNPFNIDFKSIEILQQSEFYDYLNGDVPGEVCEYDYVNGDVSTLDTCTATYNPRRRAFALNTDSSLQFWRQEAGQLAEGA